MDGTENAYMEEDALDIDVISVLPWPCGCVGTTLWRNLCRIWRTGTDGSWPVPAGRRDCGGVAASWTTG